MLRLVVRGIAVGAIAAAGWWAWQRHQIPDTSLELGRQRMTVGDFSSAVPLLEDAAAHEPDDLSIQLDLATCYDRLGDFSSALACYMIARPLLDESAPDSVTIRRHRDRFAVLVQQVRRAEAR